MPITDDERSDYAEEFRQELEREHLRRLDNLARQKQRIRDRKDERSRRAYEAEKADIRNDGVAEELTLKTNEITRKRSDFFEGTYGAHGVEEVLTKDDVIIWIDPFEDQEAKFEDVLIGGVSMDGVVEQVLDRDRHVGERAGVHAFGDGGVDP